LNHYQLLGAVLELAGSLELHCHSCPDSRQCHGDPGLPDLIIVGVRGVIWAELKTGGGRLSGPQQNWRYTLQASGQKWRLYQPADWDSGLIQAELRVIA
jgi:hypothetical protein